MLIFVTTLLLVIGASAIVAPCWGQNIDVEEDQTEMDDDGGNGGGGDRWRAGYFMGQKTVYSGFDIQSLWRFETIWCCLPMNQNTACNFTNQDIHC